VDWILAAVRACIGDRSPMAAKILASGARALARVAADEQKAYLIIKKVLKQTSQSCDLSIELSTLLARCENVGFHVTATL